MFLPELDNLGTKNFEIGSVLQKLQLFEVDYIEKPVDGKAFNRHYPEEPNSWEKFGFR